MSTLIDFAAWRQQTRPAVVSSPLDADTPPPPDGVWIRQITVYPPGDYRGPGEVAEIWHLSSGQLIADDRPMPYGRAKLRCGYSGIIIDRGTVAPWTVGSRAKAWWRWEAEAEPQGRKCRNCIRLNAASR